MAGVAVAGRRASFASSTTVIAKRSLLKFLRTPQLVWTTTIQGVLFLVIFRYLFGGAIQAGTLGYVGFVVPGILATMLIWQGMGAALSVTEDRAQGLFDRLRSLPIPRSAVLAGRALADTATTTWGLLVMTAASFLVGFRLQGGIGRALLAFALILLFSFTFETLLYMSSDGGGLRVVEVAERCKDLAGDVALQATDDLLLLLPSAVRLTR
jgi:ABC-2 type transport system permease protein